MHCILWNPTFITAHKTATASTHNQTNTVHLFHFKSLIFIHVNITFYAKVFEEVALLEVSSSKSFVILLSP